MFGSYIGNISPLIMYEGVNNCRKNPCTLDSLSVIRTRMRDKHGEIYIYTRVDIGIKNAVNIDVYTRSDG